MAAWPNQALPRTNYENGMLLQAEDLGTEQSYYESRLRDLAARLGFGVIEGLDVGLDEACPDRLWVAPGRAIDPAGRELILANRARITIDDLEGFGDSAFVCLDLETCAINQVPSLLPHHGNSSGDEDRITVTYEERGRVTVLPLGKLPPLAWRYASGLDLPPDTTGGAECVVPLARVSLNRQHRRFHPPDTLGRPWAGGIELTRITALSWHHGDTVDPIDTLVITFSAALLQAPPTAASMITIEAPDGSLRAAPQPAPTLPFAAHEGGSDDDPGRRRLILSLPSDLAPGSIVRVRLACDFVLDARGVPVSGAHPGGRLPSGDGRPGSAFESWFHIGAACADPTAGEGR